MRPIERPRSMAEEVASRIRHAIVEGDFGLGEVLSERQLAERLNVSKTPVREALAQLRLEGLVNIYPQRGVTVFTLSAREIRDICDLRYALEEAALRHAIDRHPEELARRLAVVVEAMEKAHAAGDERAYLKADTDYHQVFFECCDNVYLESTYKLYVGKLAALRTHLSRKPDHTRHSDEEHHRMLDLLRARDLPACLTLLRRHIDRVSTTYAENVSDIAAADSESLKP